LTSEAGLQKRVNPKSAPQKDLRPEEGGSREKQRNVGDVRTSGVAL